MKRLFWIGVGAAVAVAGARRFGLLDGAGGSHAPAAHRSASGSTAGTAAQAARTAFRAGATAAGAVRSLSDARREFRLGMAEREEQLRRDLVGDVDVDALRAERHRAAAAASTAAGADTAGSDWPRDAEERARARRARATREWADQPTEDPQDGDGDLPYSFS